MRSNAPALLLVLAACQASPENKTADALDAAEPANAPIKETLPPAETSAAPKAIATATIFPSAFQGRWGLATADCDPRRDDNKGLMTIAADGAKFYESRATIRSITLESPIRAVAALAVTGEGQTWERVSTLELSDGGKTLSRSDAETPTPLLYSRCQDPA